MTSDDVPPAEDLSELLADPAVWAQPSEDLEERVVEAITAEATRGRR